MKKKTVKNLIIIFIWLIIWQLAAMAIDNSIMFVGPVEVVKALIIDLFTINFYVRVLHSFAMILLGFTAALLAGCVLAAAGYLSPGFQDFLRPFMTAIKSVPVASFVVILLIWFGSASLSVYISFLIVLPNIYFPITEGLGHHDKEMKKLADISHMAFMDRVKFIYWPAVYPFLTAGLKTGIGMAYKSGVAAEVIGMSKNTLGERIYLSKINLETDQLLAWTLVVILLCYGFEKAVLKLTDSLGKHHFSSKGIRSKKKAFETPVFDKVCKCYDKNCLFMDLTINFNSHKKYMLVAPSGVGKTTVLNLLAGLETADYGLVKPVTTGIAFQEEIFLSEYSGLENLRIFSGEEYSLEELKKLFADVLPEDALCKPLKEFSGGMKRRLSVLRALLSDSSLILLDEPFSGLDEDNKRVLSKQIDLLLKNRFLVITGHYEADADLVGAERIYLWKPE